MRFQAPHYTITFAIEKYYVPVKSEYLPIVIYGPRKEKKKENRQRFLHQHLLLTVHTRVYS